MNKTTYETVKMNPNEYALVLHFNTSLLSEYSDMYGTLYKSDHDYFIPPHWHQALEITYVKKGSLKLRVNGKTTTYSSGDLLLVNSGQLHELQSNKSEDFDVQCLIISHETLQELVPNYYSYYFKLNENKKSYSDIIEKIESITVIENSESTYGYLKQNALILEIIHELLEDHSHSNDQEFIKNQQFIINVIDFIHINYEQDLTLETMSDEFSMSREHFARIFKKSVDSTFLEYLTDYRIYQAFPELVQGNQTVEAISRKHGFASAKALITQFKKRYGDTPVQYRKSHRISIIDHNEHTI